MRKALFALALLASPALAQDDGPGPNLVIDITGEANGRVVIDMLEDVAPKHVAQITELAEEGAYDGVVFHRVIEGFMAQTGDVEFGKFGSDMRMAGRGGSTRPDIPAEFSDVPYERGTVGMARSQNPDSANSQFFIMFADGPFAERAIYRCGPGHRRHGCGRRDQARHRCKRGRDRCAGRDAEGLGRALSPTGCLPVCPTIPRTPARSF